MSLLTLLSISLSVLVSAQTPDSQCFWKASNQIISEASPGWYVCNNTQLTPSGASLCCIQGSKCGEDSICHWPNGSQGGTGYYLGGCTDGSYKDDVCPRACTSHSHTFIKWNRTEQLWHCCGDNQFECDSPTLETFQALSPREWSALPSTATTTMTRTATRTGMGSATATGRGNNNNGGGSAGGLSTGAQAGIGVACGLVGVAIIGVLIFFLLRRKNRNKSAEEKIVASPEGGEGGEHTPLPPTYASQQESKAPVEQQMKPRELSAASQMPPQPQELEGTQTEPRELPGSVVQR